MANENLNRVLVRLKHVPVATKSRCFERLLIERDAKLNRFAQSHLIFAQLQATCRDAHEL
jgi:hypothetical protein